MPISLSLLVLRCADVAVSKRFYEALGLKFVAEQHSSGPRHWSSTIEDTVLELYQSGQRGPTVGRLGFRVHDVAVAVAGALSAGGSTSAKGATAQAGGAVVIDPDGNTIELSPTVSSTPR
jgi:catechol 2,3-dioxygenase-like lactoylglutathione lyase family enzyme